MPFICLATDQIPGGVLQIGDLWPNESQRNGAIDPPGQNRYLRRPAMDKIQVNATTGVVAGYQQSAAQASLTGLPAYLVDRVEPGSNLVPETTVTLAAPQAGDQLVVKGVYFQFAAGANDLAGKAGTVGDPFLVGLGAGVNAAAANLTLALNDNGDVAPAMDVPAPAGIHSVATNPGAPSAVVLIKPENGAAALVKGSSAQFTVTSSNAVRVGLDTATATVGRMVRTIERWTSTLTATAAASILNLVTTGAAATLTAVDALLLADASADLAGTAITGSNSTGTLSELLSILAGRVYSVPVGSLKFTAATDPDTVSVWSATQRGKFTTPNVVFDSDMSHGEWRPSTRWIKHGKERQSTVSGGDTVNNELAGVRTTVDTAHFQASLTTGQLGQYAGGITLFPDAAVQAFVSNWTRRTNRENTLTNQRVVTVYDDDGTLLA